MKNIPYEEYTPFYSPSFDINTVLECKDNFSLNSHINSSKVFTQERLDPDILITIAIPTYKRIKTLKECLDSAIYQDICKDKKIPYEIILVENPDDLNNPSPIKEMLQKNYQGKLTYYQNEKNLGMLGNMNRCLSLAKGKWVCILHDDDILSCDYISKMRDILKQIDTPRGGAISLVSGKPLVFYSDELKEKYKPMKKKSQIYLSIFKKTLKNILKRVLFAKLPKYIQKKSFEELIVNNCIYPSALLHNKQICTELGGYNNDFYPSDDWFFRIRCAKYYNAYLVDFISHKYRYDINESLSKKTLVGTFILYYWTIIQNPRLIPIYKKYCIKLFYISVTMQAGKEAGAVKEELKDFISSFDIDISPISLKENLIGKFYNMKYFD